MQPFFSPATARRMVDSQMRNQYLDVARSFEQAMLAGTSHLPQSLSYKRKWFVAKAKEVFGDMLIEHNWSGRILQYLVILPFLPDGDCSRPYKALIRAYQYSLRANHMSSVDFVVLTTHAMERLLERRKDARLSVLLVEEFNMDFIGDILEFLVQSTDGTEFKIRTENGWACGLMQESVPTVLTWYPI